MEPSRTRVAHGGRCGSALRSSVFVLAWLRELADEVGEAAAQAKEAERRQLRSRTDAQAAAREVAEIDRQLAELTRQLVAGRVPESVYDTARDELMAERDEHEQRLTLAEQHAREVREPAHIIARGLLDEWDTLPVLDCRELLAQVIRYVQVTPGQYKRAPITIRVIPALTNSTH